LRVSTPLPPFLSDKFPPPPSHTRTPNQHSRTDSDSYLTCGFVGFFGATALTVNILTFIR
jgi:hypothetical protein